MKKHISVLLIITLVMLEFLGCGKADNISTPVNVYALKGPTAMGMVKMMDEASKGNGELKNAAFNIEGAVDAVTAKLASGEADIACIPANLASVLYNKTNGGIKVLAINTLGVLYLVESGNSIEGALDLKNKTIYASGKGATPEYALNYFLSSNGIDPLKDVNIEYKSEHTEVVSALKADNNGVALLPQPFVTTVMMSDENVRIAIDLNEEWEKCAKSSGSDATLVTGVVVVRKEFAENNAKLIESFLKAYEKSVSYTNEDIEGAAALIEEYDIIKAGVAKKAIPYCNITYIAGEDMKNKLSGYLGELFLQNPASVGGAMPDEDFYYTSE